MANKIKENRYRELFERSADAILILVGNKFVDCNASTVKMLRYANKHDLLNTHPSQLSPEHQPDGRLSHEKAEEMIAIAFKKGSHRFEWDHMRADGEVFPVEVLLTVVLEDGQNSLHVVWREISDRIKAQKALLRLTSIIESTSDMVATVTPEGKIQYVNNAGLEMIGWKPESLSYKKISDLHPKWALKIVKQGVPEAISKGTWVGEAAIFGKNGHEIPVSQVIMSHKSPQGELEYLSTIIRDITDRVQAGAALKDSEEKFRALVEKSPHGISLIGKDGHYKYINPQFSRIFGYTFEDTPTGTAWFNNSFPDKDYRHEVIKTWVEDQKHVKVGQARPRIFAVTCKDGSKKEIHFRPVTLESLDQFVIYEDITEKSKMETQLQQAQKFKAIGTLAGGIAHDFNNLLMGIQGRVSLMSMDSESNHSHGEHIDAIEDYIRSATDLTQQLLGFARGGKYEVKPTDINQLVRNSVNMFGRTKKELRIHVKFHKPAPVAIVDFRQIEQVMLNLYVNAWQAMPTGGELNLETEIATLNDIRATSNRVSPGNYVKVSVADTGIGMEENTRQQIFNPFFTTKDKGRGTGLGLASAYGIIKNHDGFITVHSKIGHGTTFNIYLPLSDREAYRDVPLQDKLFKGSETVLLVDDEEMILEVGQAMLEKLGYRVMVADSGQQALDVIKRKGSEIDLIILDLIMPGMDGGMVFDRIKEIRPQTSVMLSSGYAINGQADEIMKRGCNGFVQKPYNISELSQKVRKILDEAKGSAQ